MRFATAVMAALSFLASGCATRFENAPLSSGRQNNERRMHVVRPEQPVILVAISGGGSRAAALGWAVLERLKGISYTAADGSTRRLTDDIAAVSSVSGGSVTAAYFGLRGPDALDDMPRSFFRPNNIRWLVLRAINPLTWVRLKARGSSRIQLEEELFDERLFRGASFEELNQPGKPFIVLNATDMATGEVFGFTPQRFDDICSELDREPVATAVAASAAFPIAMSPVAFRNYSIPNCKDRPVPQWITNRLNGDFARYANLSEFKSARYAYDLRKGGDGMGTDVFRQIDFLYLLDGGLADNLGIHGLIEALSSAHGPRIVWGTGECPGSETILQAINCGDIRRLAVIVINARSDPPESTSQSRSRPGVIGMIKSVTSTPLDATTASVNSQMEILLAQMEQGGLRVYNVQVDFDQFRATDPAQKRLRDQAKIIPTSWSISDDDLRVLDESAEVLLKGNPCFQRLLLDSGIRADFADPAYAKKGCPQLDDQPNRVRINFVAPE
jgi:NTE family protein